MARVLLILCAIIWASPLAAQTEGTAAQEGVAQNPQTLADIRTDIDALKAEIEALRTELALNDPSISGIANTGPVLDRVDALEAELRLLTDQVEGLRFRIERIVADGTNRIGDLEFRLLELEGGDFSTLGETLPLGQGDTTPRERPTPEPTGSEVAAVVPEAVDLTKTRPRLRDGTVAAVAPAPAPQPPVADPAPAPTPQPPAAAPGEDAFRTALTAFRSGDYFEADRLFSDYLSSYPGSARAGEAAFWRGESLAAQNDWQSAARSYLDSFSGTPDGAYAPDALFRLGVSLGRLGQIEQACRTLSEVPRRYSNLTADLSSRVAAERAALTCP